MKQTKDNFYGMNDYLISLSNIRPPLILLRLSNNTEKYNLYYDRAKKLNNVINQFQENIIMEVTKQYNMNKYKKQEFDSYVFGILEKDACQIVSDHADLLADKSFNKDKCYSINNGIFGEGIVKSVKFFLELFQQRWNVYEIKSPKQFLQEIQKQEKEFNIEQIYDFRTYLNYILSTVYKFIEQLSIDHYNQMIVINRALISISIFTFIISIYVAYYKFFERSIDQLRLTKQLLDIIDIHALEENQYILTYLKLQK